MKILHISDFHFKSGNKHKIRQEQVVNKFIEIKNNFKKIDLIVFTGDLVQNGTDKKNFISAKEIVLDKIAKEIDFDPRNIIICPGNHDVDRTERLDSIIEYVDRLTNNEDLNKFLKKKEFNISCKPIINYNNFVKENFDYDLDVCESLYNCHIREIDGKNTGIISINSAWRSLGMQDDNSLLYPTDLILEALSHITETEYRILLMHHPLSDFKAYNESKLEDILHANFDLVLTGHIHKSKDSIDLTANAGMIRIGAPAALSLDHNSQIGIGSLSLDFEENEFLVSKFLYDNQNNCIYEVKKGPFDIPTEERKRELNKFREKLKNKYLDELSDAKNLFVSRESDLDEKTFHEVCADPVLKSKSSNEINKDTSPADELNWVELNSANKDYLILGKGKCGKTVLLKKIQLDLLRHFSEYKTIPFYVNCKKFDKLDSTFNLETELYRYYGINRANVKKILSDDNVLLLLDDFQSLKEGVKEQIAEQISGRANIKVIATSDETTLNSLEDISLDSRVFTKLYFHRLRKKHIKQLTGKIHNVPLEKQDEIVDKINSIFTKLSIPFNFWSISLFLWIFKKDLNSNFQNDVELINLYIEKLLEKEQLTIDGTSFGYDKYKRFLAHLAHKLLTDCHESDYCFNYQGLIDFTQEYLNKNPRYNITAREVINYIEERGILAQKVGEKDLYTFRLNGVFEYFVAHYMTLNKEFLDLTIKDDKYYLSFSNEFELYAGFKRDDEVFLDKIYQKTKLVYKNVNIDSNKNEITLDKQLVSKLVDLNNYNSGFSKITEKLKDGLSIDQQDKIEEELNNEAGLTIDNQSEVRKKEAIKLDESIESLEKTLSILGGVYKNIDEISDQKKVYEIFNYILDSACNWGFKIIDDVRTQDIEDLLNGESGDEAKELLKLITQFIPTIVQARLNDMIGHKNVEKIILEQIKELKKDAKNNQYKLFLLHYLLCDISLVKHRKKLDDLIELLTIPTLKYSSLLKLTYYLGFKTNENPKDAKYFRDKIQLQQLSFDKETQLGDLHKSLENKKKKGFINK